MSFLLVRSNLFPIELLHRCVQTIEIFRDFHLAHHVGRIKRSEPNGAIEIITFMILFLRKAVLNRMDRAGWKGVLLIVEMTRL